MPSLKHLEPERLILKGYSELSEKWVQERIAEAPTRLAA